MKRATLDQAQKVLMFLEAFSCEEVQDAIESGVIVNAIRDRQGVERCRVNQIWGIVKAVTNGKFEGVVITVPHDPCPHRFDGRKFQVRCWRAGAKFGPGRGHIDGGVDIMETFLDKPLNACECCWPTELSNAGLDIRQGDWVRKVVTAQDGSMYDHLTFKQEESGLIPGK